MFSTPFLSARHAATKKGQLGYRIAALASKNSHSSRSRPKGGAGGANIPPIGE
ncbi:hypothetical protein [Mesorhizobium sp.]|uniref:hypothetical protein n=1 Tax=Mesorhizobium sp. TaxID=1871066 RepID=UPI003390600E